MKKTIILMIFLSAFFMPVYSQTLLIKHAIVQPMKIWVRTDSLNTPIYRTDSIDINIIISFDHLTKEIGELSIYLGSEKNEYNFLKKTVSIINNDGSYFTKSDTETQKKLGYGKNFIIKYRIKYAANLNWASLSYKNEQKTLESPKYYCEIKK